VINFTALPFSAEKEPGYPLNRRLGRPQRESGSFGEKKNFIALLGFESELCSESSMTPGGSDMSDYYQML